MKEFNCIALVKHFAGVVSAVALASAISLPVLAQTRTEQLAQNPGSSSDAPGAFDGAVPGPSQTPSGSPAVQGPNRSSDPDLNQPSNGNPSQMNQGTSGSSMQDSSNNVETDSSRVISSGDQVRSLPFRTIPGPSETPSGSPSVIGSNSSADPARSIDRSVSDRVEETGRRLEAQNSTSAPGAFETNPGPSETPSGSPAVPGFSRPNDPGFGTQQNDGSMQMNQRMEMNTPMNQPGATPNSSSRTTPNSTVSRLDREFIRMAAESNNAEIATSQLALQKSNNVQVREYAQRMIDEHTRANQQLQPIASRYGVQLPTGVDPLSAAISERLSPLSGQQFDRAYTEAQTTAHLRAVSLFQTQIAQGQAADVKSFASTLLPNIADHYQMANAMSNTFSAQRPNQEGMVQ